MSDIEHTEYRCFGPPGTGKTTWISAQVHNGAGKFGGSNVLVSSFTRAAAAELAGRDLPIPERNVGTLHAIAYRSLGHPTIATGKLIQDFAEHFPRWRLATNSQNLDEPFMEPTKGGPGEEAMGKMEILRARMIPSEAWPGSVRAFSEDWIAWKQGCGYLDFTDLIEACLKDVETAPGNPRIAFIDEVQDLVPLQLALVRKWAKAMSHVVLCGDDEQCLYRWIGATPDAFLDPPLPSEFKRVLSQSYRIPRAVHTLATRWSSRLSRREPKEYLPRPEDGQVTHSSATWKYPEPILQELQPYLDAGKSVMILATCGYMLAPLMAILRRAALPFHNPYRVSRGDWNPLQHGTPKRTTAVDRVLAFLRPDTDTWQDQSRTWTCHDVYLWASLLQARGLLRTGAKGFLEAWKGDESPFSGAEFLSYLEPSASDALENLTFADRDQVRKSLAWWLENCLVNKRRTLEFPAAVASRHGGVMLRAKPQIITGTVHSVKGGEASTVFLFPDLSYAGMREWVGPREEQDAIIRCLYVGITRARDTLVLCRPASCCAVNLE